VAGERRRVAVAPAVPDERTDVAVLRALQEAGVAITRASLAKAFAAGEVTRDGVALKPGRALDRIGEVDVVLPGPEPLAGAEPEDLPLVVVFEDDALLVIDKPAGMPVHAGPGHAHGTVVNAVLGRLGAAAAELPSLPGNAEDRPGIVHRIDKDTSGLLVVTKTVAAQEHVAAQFRRHTIERSYLAIVMGEPSWDELDVDTLHGRDPADRRRFSPNVKRGRRAVTRLRVEQRLAGLTLLRCVLQTGRTHQIRMHARHVGHPILGDALYGKGIGDPDLRREVAALGRHALHAATLGLEHPDGRRLRWESALPPELAALVRAHLHPAAD
jgi:23S rRNA pseudouridine1911/1915/1917 synthase